MRDDQHRFMALVGQPPARLTSEQAAWVLGCQPHDIPVLVAAKLLRPLGQPEQNSTKYYAAVEVLECAKDSKWLNKATTALSRHWHAKNDRIRKRASRESEVGRVEGTNSPPVNVDFSRRQAAASE